MGYSSITIANYFLEKAKEESRALTPLQLIKLVHLAHAYHLGSDLGPLINDDPAVALDYGPAHLKLYDKIRHFRSFGVQGPLSHPAHAWFQTLKGESRALVDSVWETFSTWSGIQLSTLTHEAGSPWDHARQSPAHVVISDELIASYYRKILAEAKKSSPSTAARALT